MMPIFSFVGPDVIPHKHYGKHEVLGKIVNMEAKYDKPMHFNPDLLPTSSRATGDDLKHGFWDYGVAGKVKKGKGKQNPTLEAAQYGFRGGEELILVKQYLYSHRKNQLVAVSLILFVVLG